MFGLGAMEIIIILGLALIFIGPKKLPELARGIGKAFKEFQNAAKGITSVINEPIEQIKKDIPTAKDLLQSEEEKKKDHSIE